MIKLGCELLESKIEFDDNNVKVLEIKNKRLFNELIYKLNKSINSDEILEGIILLEEDKEISFNKNAMIIYDFFNLDINQSKIIKNVYEEISKEYKLNYDDENIVSLQKELLGSIRTILYEYNYEFTQKEVLDIKDILKIMELKLDINYYDKPLDNLLLLFELIANFSICKLLILVNLKAYVEEEEISEVYKMIKYRGINVLVIEYNTDDIKKQRETKVIIDEDYDEFYIK